MAASCSNAFHVAVERVLGSWTVLKLAVSHGFGGADSQAKGEWMVYAVEQWFSENANIESYELEDFLADILDHEFDTVADDNSLPEIARMICGFYKLCQEGNEAKIREKLDSLPQPAVQNCVKQVNRQGLEDDSEDDDDDDGDDNPDPPPLVAMQQPMQQHQNNDVQETMETEEEEDGWSTVGKKGKRRR